MWFSIVHVELPLFISDKSAGSTSPRPGSAKSSACGKFDESAGHVVVTTSTHGNYHMSVIKCCTVECGSALCMSNCPYSFQKMLAVLHLIDRNLLRSRLRVVSLIDSISSVC